MEERVYLTKDQFTPGMTMKIIVKDSQGLYLGQYRGYYNPLHRTVKLYPSHNPRRIDLPVKEISTYFIKKI